MTKDRKCHGNEMNAARQRLRRVDRSMGTQTRSTADYSITATISVVPDPLDLVRNLKYMRAFAAAWPNRKLIVQAPLAQLAWYSQIALIEKLKSEEDRLGYAQLAVENHWLRPQLVREIAARSIENLGKSANNFALTMPISTWQRDERGAADIAAVRPDDGTRNAEDRIVQQS